MRINLKKPHTELRPEALTIVTIATETETREERQVTVELIGVLLTGVCRAGAVTS